MIHNPASKLHCNNASKRYNHTVFFFFSECQKTLRTYEVFFKTLRQTHYNGRKETQADYKLKSHCVVMFSLQWGLAKFGQAVHHNALALHSANKLLNLVSRRLCLLQTKPPPCQQSTLVGGVSAQFRYDETNHSFSYHFRCPVNDPRDPSVWMFFRLSFSL